MPIKQIALFASISAFFFFAVFVSFYYGPTRRSYVSTPKIEAVGSSGQLAKALGASGVKGRVAIYFTRYLNAIETKESKEPLVTELAMDQGIIRKVFHVIPENAWTGVQTALLTRYDMRQTPEGFIGVFNSGRVYITRLSMLPPIKEKAILIVEPKVWTQEELIHIGEIIKSSYISSDLMIIIRGTGEDAEIYRTAMAL